MSFVIISGERLALELGETRLGGRAPGTLESDAVAALPPFAVIDYPIAGPTTLRVLGHIPVVVNGARVGADPRPLQHGDLIEAGGVSIAFGDMQRAGATHRSGPAVDDTALGTPLGDAAPTASTGGRVLRLSTGTEHPVADAGLTLGRDPDSTVVIASRDASRVHASIAPGLLGYMVTDRSSNGVWVNGIRVDGAQLLGQGDVIRIADEEFRFFADEASFTPDVPPTGAAMAVPAVPSGRAVPATPAEPPMLLASLEVLTEGEWKGRRFRIERPAVQLGRGPHNDIVIAYESVSSSHASLVLRNRTWHVLDLNSRNGTYVENEAVHEQRVLPSVCELRLGTLTLLFRAINTMPAGGAQGTVRVIGLP